MSQNAVPIAQQSEEFGLPARQNILVAIDSTSYQEAMLAYAVNLARTLDVEALHCLLSHPTKTA